MMMTTTHRTRTANGANAYTTSSDPTVDLFANVVPDTDTGVLFRMLDEAWTHSPDITLRCIFHLRDIRHGKSDAARFSDALYWLYSNNHFGTLMANVKHVPGTGYWKDLLNFLVRLTVGEEEHRAEAARVRECERTRVKRKEANKEQQEEWNELLEKAKREDAKWEKPDGWPKHRVVNLIRRFHRSPRAHSNQRGGRSARSSRYDDGDDMDIDSNVNPLSGRPWSSTALKRQRWFRRLAAERRNGGVTYDPEAARLQNKVNARAVKEEATRLRREKRTVHADALRGRFQTDEKYRNLHLEIARMFASALDEDEKKMKAFFAEAEKQTASRNRKFDCSLAAKWAPTLGAHHDKLTFIATTIAQLLFPESHVPMNPGEQRAGYIRRLRKMYTKHYIVPLRKHTKIVESFLGYGQCGDIEYNRVPSLSMRRNRPLFERLDKERFETYLEDVAAGKTTIAGSALKPHVMVEEILHRTLAYNGYLRDDVLEETLEDKVRAQQWASYRDRLTKTGKLQRVLAVCDVSGSMRGEPMNVAIALGLLCAQVTAPPFNQLLCTFSQRPELFRIPDGALADQVTAISQMDAGLNTDFEAVFKLILDRATATHLPAADMVSTLIVFSDMEFDEARSTDGRYPGGDWMTLHESMQRMYEREGYTLPKIVFWNLAARRGRGRMSFPVSSDTEGVAMVSGFSGQLLKLFMKGHVDFNPAAVMKEALERYDHLKVVD
ncbi:hypothetical protein DFJ77DRAFT_475237 [Powellomyces hirtus]|nr:hypothetical protein DFJ77DRAFT_475237 [Powellomyces hirtus]